MNYTCATNGEAIEVDICRQVNWFNYNSISLRDRLFGIYLYEIFDAEYCTQIKGMR